KWRRTMKRDFLRNISILVLVFLFSTPVFGQLSQSPPAPSPVVSKQVEPNIYVFTGGRGANTGAYIGEKEVLLIDSKQDSSSVAQVLAAIKKLTNAPVTRLVNTHADADHVFGNRFQPAGVIFIAHENCLKEFFVPSMNGTPSDWNNPALKAFLPSVIFKDRMELQIGTKRVQIYHFGIGHTTGDTVVYFPDEKVAFIGDQIFTTRVQLIHAYKGGSSFGEVAALEKMLSTIDAQKFVCGHNDVIDRAAVQNHISQMKALQEKVLNLKMKGQSMEEVQKQFKQNQSVLVQTIHSEIK
ncbi:MAG: MBL fold metallo-hydrolase, partial [Deltaproteobacteria bacterium]